MPMMLNPDQKYVDELYEAIEKLNGGCPCVPKHAQNADTICPCLKFREKNECHCNLYVEG